MEITGATSVALGLREKALKIQRVPKAEQKTHTSTAIE